VPQIDLIPEVLYNPLNPYHYYYDNLPLKNILTRVSLVNDTVDIAYGILTSAIGTQGTLSNRLAQSINPDGSLVAFAVDNAEHNIGYHSDGIGPDSVAYVRMKASESAKLALVSDNATDLKVLVDAGSPVLFDSGTLEFVSTPGLTWTVASGNKLSLSLSFPVASAHTHYYDLSPISSNYINYKTTTVSTPCIPGSLRVSVNGIRLSASTSLYVPVGASRTLTLLTYTPSESSGTFALSSAITAADVIRIDFDTSFV
jgi:hypothetical protein